MEESQTISTIRVGLIVTELTKLRVFWANLRVEGTVDGGLLSIKPVAVSV